MEGQPVQSAPVVEQPHATPAPSEESANGASPQASPTGESFNMDDFIRGRAFGGSAASKPDGVVPTAELSASAEEPAPDGGVKPADVPPGAPGLDRRAPSSRRGAAATIESLTAELESLRSSIPEQVAEAQRQAEEARSQAQTLRQQQEQAEAGALELIGDPDEYQRLLDTPDHELSNEDYTRRETWKANRKVYQPVTERLRTEEAARAHAWVAQTGQTWATQALAVADELGVDRAELSKPENRDIGRLMKLAASATEARVRGEYAERVSQTERDLSAARTEALSRNGPVIGQANGAGAGFDMDTWIRQKAGVSA